MMQSALSFAPTFLPLPTPIKSKSLTLQFRFGFISAKHPALLPPTPTPTIKAAAAAPEADEATTSGSVDYSSITSVFPAEACDTIGGEACDAEMYPEVKLEPVPRDNEKPQKSAAEQVEREYLEYNGAKTVFPGDACDELGGEFCQPEYQRGVYH